MGLISLGQQRGGPAPPVWFADEVELWARQWGRHAVTRWEPAVGCFVSHLSRRPSDPVLAKVQSGQMEEAHEPFYWMEWVEQSRKHPITGQFVGGYQPLDVEQLGASGVRQMLDEANLWSGTGRAADLFDAADQLEAKNKSVERDKRRTLNDALKEPTRATFRHARGLPQVSVPDDLTTEE